VGLHRHEASAPSLCCSSLSTDSGLLHSEPVRQCPSSALTAPRKAQDIPALAIAQLASQKQELIAFSVCIHTTHICIYTVTIRRPSEPWPSMGPAVTPASTLASGLHDAQDVLAPAGPWAPPGGHVTLWPSGQLGPT
jgi:hypothetical protein